MTIRITDTDQLLTATDVARMFEVTAGAVTHWLDLPDFPEPVTHVNNGRTPLWLASKVRRWYDNRPVHGRSWMYRNQSLG